MRLGSYYPYFAGLLFAIVMPQLSLAQRNASEELEKKPSLRLIKCPDCEARVSRRAVMCPHCGCPGEAIHEAVRLEEELTRPKTIVRVVNDRDGGFGVVIKDKAETYAVFDIFLLAGSNKLELRDLRKGLSVAYTGIEIALGEGLIRLKVREKSLAVRGLAPKGQEATAFIGMNDAISAKERALIAVDDAQRVCSIKKGDKWIPINQGLQWKAVTPKQLRPQLNLLYELSLPNQAGATAVEPSQNLPEKWLTPYFSDLATLLTR